MEKYRVESRNNNGKFIVDCLEKDLKYWMAFCKYDAIQTKGQCYYRRFPLTLNNKVYYSKGNDIMTEEELSIMSQRI